MEWDRLRQAIVEVDDAKYTEAANRLRLVTDSAECRCIPALLLLRAILLFKPTVLGDTLAEWVDPYLLLRRSKACVAGKEASIEFFQMHRAFILSSPTGLIVESLFRDHVLSEGKTSFELLQQSMQTRSTPIGIYCLGVFYDQGKGITKDAAKAFKLYTQAALFGHASAMSNLALCLDNGDGCPQDKQAAVDMMRKGASLGSPAALFNLSSMLRDPDRQYGEAERKESVTLLLQAARKGHCGAQYMLGLLHDRGEDGIQASEVEARHYFSLAAEQGNSAAQNNYAVYLYNGIGGVADKIQASEMFRRSADQGDLYGMRGLALCLRLGEGGLVKDIPEALRLLHKAAAGNHSQALCDLGVLYCLGDIVEQDSRLAYKYLSQATEAGSVTASRLLIKFQTV